MTFIIKEPSPQFTFTFREYGELYCFPLTAGGMDVLSDNENKQLSDSDYVLLVISLACHPKEKLKDGEYRPSEFSFQMKGLSRISEDELEHFSKQYVEHNEFLCKSNDKEGTIGKNDDESFMTFLRRLHEHYLSSSGAFGGALSGYSKVAAIAENFAKLSASAKVSKILSGSTLASIEALRKKEDTLLSNISQFRPAMPPVPLTVSYKKFPVQETVNQLRELTTLIVESNRVQENIAEDLADAIRKSKVTTLINTGISLSVLFLTVTGLWLAYSVSKENTEQMNTLTHQLKKNSMAIVKPLELLKSSSDATNEENKKLIRAIESLTAETRELRESQTVKE